MHTLNNMYWMHVSLFVKKWTYAGLFVTYFIHLFIFLICFLHTGNNCSFYMNVWFWFCLDAVFLEDPIYFLEYEVSQNQEPYCQMLSYLSVKIQSIYTLLAVPCSIFVNETDLSLPHYAWSLQSNIYIKGYQNWI